MLIRSRLYLIAILLMVLSVVNLIYSIKNKNAAVCRLFIVGGVLAIVYLWVSIFAGPLLSVDFGFEIFLFYLFGAIATIVYVISIVINAVKRKSIMKTYFATEFSIPKALKIIMLILIILPILFVSVRVIRDRILIATSDAIVVFHSSGNGGIGDGHLFAFGIQGKKCKQFDLGIDLALDELVPRNMERIKPRWDETIVGEYEIIIDEDEIITIMKGNQKIFRYDTYKHGFFNIDIEEGYYKTK